MSDDDNRNQYENTEMVNCPYNIQHRMLRKRLQQHLLRCRLNYPDAELVKCPFNQVHLVPEPEYEIHCRSCQDRKILMQYKHNGAAPINLEEYKHKPIECLENWDDEDAEDYKPQEYAQKANIVRQPDGIFPAERKQFIKQERKRLGCEFDDKEGVIIENKQIVETTRKYKTEEQASTSEESGAQASTSEKQWSKGERDLNNRDDRFSKLGKYYACEYLKKNTQRLKRSRRHDPYKDIKMEMMGHRNTKQE